MFNVIFLQIDVKLLQNMYITKIKGNKKGHKRDGSICALTTHLESSLKNLL